MYISESDTHKYIHTITPSHYNLFQINSRIYMILYFHYILVIYITKIKYYRKQVTIFINEWNITIS